MRTSWLAWRPSRNITRPYRVKMLIISTFWFWNRLSATLLTPGTDAAALSCVRQAGTLTRVAEKTDFSPVPHAE